MELTRRCDYACRILRSAYRHRDTYISIADVSEEEDIPYAFARTIQHDLATAGYLKTIRGAHGGLSLAINPAEKTILDVLCALQGPVSVSPCAGDSEACSRSGDCSFNRVWGAADKVLNSLFSAITLQDVFDADCGASTMNDIDEKIDEVVRNSVADVKSGAPCSAARS